MLYVTIAYMWHSSSWAGMWCMAAAIIFTTATTTIDNDRQRNAFDSIVQTNIAQWPPPPSISPPINGFVSMQMCHLISWWWNTDQKEENGRQDVQKKVKKGNPRKVNISLTPHRCPLTISQEISAMWAQQDAEAAAAGMPARLPWCCLFFSNILLLLTKKYKNSTEPNSY